MVLAVGIERFAGTKGIVGAGYGIDRGGGEDGTKKEIGKAEAVSETAGLAARVGGVALAERE